MIKEVSDKVDKVGEDKGYIGTLKRIENPGLLPKIHAYKKSQGLTTWDDKSISRECRKLEKELDIEKVEPKQYKILRKISEGLKIGEKVDLSAAARWAGYPDWKVKRPEATILRSIDPALFNRLVGINRNEIEMELMKVLKQDDNLSAKNKAIDLAARITGMSEPDKGVQVLIANVGATVAD